MENTTIWNVQEDGKFIVMDDYNKKLLDEIRKTFPVVLINEEFIGGYTELFDRLRGKDEV